MEKTKRNAAPFLALLFSAIAASAAVQERPDFGPRGLSGLTGEQREKLDRGEIILPKGAVETSGEKTLIEAALIFAVPPAEVYRLLSRGEDQAKYLAEVKSVVVLAKTPGEEHLEFTTKVMTKTVVYRQITRFEPDRFYIHWSLDEALRIDLKELNGYWRFYPYAEGKTLARYGSRVLPRFPVPGFIRSYLAKSRLRSALEDAKRYVESGGTWEKRRNSTP
jgi:uncharacterized protein YndB with AHSA1/START domain